VRESDRWRVCVGLLGGEGSKLVRLDVAAHCTRFETRCTFGCTSYCRCIEHQLDAPAASVAAIGHHLSQSKQQQRDQSRIGGASDMQSTTVQVRAACDQQILHHRPAAPSPSAQRGGEFLDKHNNSAGRSADWPPAVKHDLK